MRISVVISKVFVRWLAHPILSAMVKISQTAFLGIPCEKYIITIQTKIASFCSILLLTKDVPFKVWKAASNAWCFRDDVNHNQTAFWLFRSGKVYLILSSEALIYQI